MLRLAPVIELASSLHRNNASAATCSGRDEVLGRLRGKENVVHDLLAGEARVFIVSGICFSTSGVQT